MKNLYYTIISSAMVGAGLKNTINDLYERHYGLAIADGLLTLGFGLFTLGGFKVLKGKINELEEKLKSYENKHRLPGSEDF